jgi:hypothetical protein
MLLRIGLPFVNPTEPPPFGANSAVFQQPLNCAYFFSGRAGAMKFAKGAINTGEL